MSLPVDDAPSSVTLMPSHGFDMTGLIRFFRHAHGESFPGRIHCILIKVTDVDEFREGLSPLLSALYPRLLDSLKALLREMIADEETLRAPG